MLLLFEGGYYQSNTFLRCGYYSRAATNNDFTVLVGTYQSADNNSCINFLLQVICMKTNTKIAFHSYNVKTRILLRREVGFAFRLSLCHFHSQHCRFKIQEFPQAQEFKSGYIQDTVSGYLMQNGTDYLNSGIFLNILQKK